ncbi:hypothetical protein HYU50_04185 [Candidatus Woesearchaeota archaeon]|nr:hypothetical protein [Candidatus Woesearchaeota archaeon]
MTSQYNIQKKLILVLGILFLIVLSGCKGTSNKSITDEDVRKGFDGLAMTFTKNAPPDKVFEQSIFPIGIELKNKGASDIVKGFLVMGFEKEYVDALKEAKETFDIKGKSIFNLNGDGEFKTLNAQAKKVGSQSETHPSTILATACYPYRTVLGTSVCIDTDVFGKQLRKKACQAKDLEFTNGQGAPIAITKVEVRMLPDADNDPNKVIPHFIIYIENKGNGEVVAEDKIEDVCSKKPLGFKDFNMVNIRASLSDKELNCNLGEAEKAEARLREKKDIIRCTLEEGVQSNRDAFTSPLKIELDYGYTLTISKDITIEKILTY